MYGFSRPSLSIHSVKCQFHSEYHSLDTMLLLLSTALLLHIRLPHFDGQAGCFTALLPCLEADGSQPQDCPSPPRRHSPPSGPPGQGDQYKALAPQKLRWPVLWNLLYCDDTAALSHQPQPGRHNGLVSLVRWILKLQGEQLKVLPAQCSYNIVR
jgi:hypothetical protein